MARRKKMDPKPEAFYLRNMPGMNTRKETLEQDANYVEKAQNARFEEEYGSCKKRTPLRYYNSSAKTTAATDGIFRYYTSGGTIKLIMISNGVAYVGTDATGAFTSIRTLGTSGKRPSFEVYKDLLIVSDGYNNPWVYDGASDNVSWELGACKAVTGTGGQLDASAAYYYAVTIDEDAYVCGAVSNTVTTDATNKQVALTNIPLGQTGTADRRIYRVEGGGSTLKMVHILSDNTTTSWTDKAADGGTISSAADGGGGEVDFTTAAAHGLQVGDRVTIAGTTDYNGNFTVVGVADSTTFSITDTWVDDQSGTWALGETMPSVTDDIPVGSILRIYRERLFVTGDPNNPNYIYYSKPYLPHLISHTTDTDVMKVDENDNDEIMGIPIHLGTMLCIKKNTIRRLHITGPTSGWDSSQWYADDPHVHSGAQSQWSVTETPYGVLYLGWDQWYIYTNQSQAAITEFDISNMMKERRSEVNGFWHKEIFYAAYTDASTAATYHDRIMVYDFKQKKLSYDTIDGNCFTAYTGDDETGDLLIGDSTAGTVYKAEEGVLNYRLYTEDGCNAGTLNDVYVGTSSGRPYMEIGDTTSASEIPDDVCIFWDNESTAPGSGWTEVSLAAATSYTPAGTLAFTDSDPDTITDSDSEFVNKGFVAGQMVTVQGSGHNDGTYEIATVAAGTITLAASETLTAEADCYGSITAFAYKHYDDTAQTVVTSATHGLAAGEKIIIQNTSNYDGTYYVQYVLTANTFVINATFSATETGDWYRPITLSTAQPFIYIDDTNDPGTVGGTDLHTHTYSGTTASAYGSLANVGQTGAGSAFQDSHTHSVSGTTMEGICNPRHVKLRLFKKNSTTTEYQFPVGAICMWDNATAPDGWQGLDSTYDGYYLRLGKSSLLTTYSTTHTHDIIDISGAYSGNALTCDAHGGAGARNEHKHCFQATTASGSPSWEEDYVEMRFIKRVGDESTWDGVDNYIYALFYAAQATAASNGFSDVSSTYDGRLLKMGSGSIDTGAGAGGGHTHTINSLTTNEDDYGYGGGGDQQQAGGSHDHTLVLTETASTDPSAPPYMSFRMVRKVLGQMQDYNTALSSAYTTGRWVSPAIEIQAQTLSTWYWNETLVGSDSIDIFSRTATTSAGVTDGTSTTATNATNKFTTASHGLSNGNRITIGGTAVPTGISKNIMYYVVGVAGNDFQVSLTSGGSAVTFSDDGTAVTFKSWDGPHSDPNGTAASSSASTYLQYCIAFTAGDTTVANPRIYYTNQYIVKLEYVKASSIGETSVEFIYEIGFRNFNLPTLDKLFKKLTSIHAVDQGSTSDGSVVISWETENSSNSWTVDLDNNPTRWESFFHDTAMGRRVNIKFTKDDLINFTLKEVQGIYNNLPLIV